MILKKCPSLDVHGETRDTVVYPVRQFLKDNALMGNEHIVIIHGRGSGVLKNKVHEILKKEPIVKEYYIQGMNLGATEVILKVYSRKY